MKVLINISFIVLILMMISCKKEVIRFPKCSYTKDYLISSSGIIKTNYLLPEQSIIDINTDTLYTRLTGGFLSTSSSDCKDAEYVDDKIVDINVYGIADIKTINLDSVVYFKYLSLPDYYSKYDFLSTSPQKIQDLLIVLWNYSDFQGINSFKLKVVIHYKLENNITKSTVLITKDFYIE